jgi:hypothetical protein
MFIASALGVLSRHVEEMCREGQVAQEREMESSRAVQCTDKNVCDEQQLQCDRHDTMQIHSTFEQACCICCMASRGCKDGADLSAFSLSSAWKESERTCLASLEHSIIMPLRHASCPRYRGLCASWGLGRASQTQRLGCCSSGEHRGRLVSSERSQPLGIIKKGVAEEEAQWAPTSCRASMLRVQDSTMWAPSCG